MRSNVEFRCISPIIKINTNCIKYNYKGQLRVKFIIHRSKIELYKYYDSITIINLPEPLQMCPRFPRHHVLFQTYLDGLLELQFRPNE